MSESSAMILGVSGPRLTREEERFFRDVRPWGFILFARNIEGPAQLADLVAALRQTVGDPQAPILVDQEGGRVQRLRPPLAPNYPPAAALGALHERDREAGRRATWLMSRLHAFDLARVGVNVDCLPVLDIPVPGAHDVIGDRAYGSDVETVSALGRAAMEGLEAGGVLPVVKHIPGHGRANVDSHHGLPVVDTAIEALRGSDFVPFARLSDAPMAMSAHVVYSAVDAALPATMSGRLIAEVIRGEIGFDGLLMTDDLSMKALSGDFGMRARASLAAGCDVVLHCNGDMDEMRAVAAAVGVFDGEALDRARRACARLRVPDLSDEAALREEFAALTFVSA